MNVVEVLVKAKAKIANEEKWCQGIDAEDKKGREVEPWSKEAIRWCAVGAVEFVMGTYSSDSVVAYLDAASKEFGFEWIVATNDKGNLDNHQLVMDVYDRAIELATECEWKGRGK